jgi:flagellar hook-length control protein FliK
MTEVFSAVNTNPQQRPVIKLENINLAVKDGLKDPLKSTHLHSNDGKIALPATVPVTAATVPVTLASVAAPAVICESGYITSPPTFDDRSEYSAADTLPEKFEQQTLRRQEEQADMSRRLAEALGQRLTAQISRGAWRVEMDLHPKSLGRIEIQLEMKNGELEANFTAANAATRELIQESMPRLRAAFEEHGMESAYIGLGLENQSQSDGKPTGQNSPNEVETTSDSEESQLNAQTSRLDQYGLDLLV